MPICVNCCDVISTKKIEKAGWEKVDGRWHCPICKGDAKVASGNTKTEKKSGKRKDSGKTSEKSLVDKIEEKREKMSEDNMIPAIANAFNMPEARYYELKNIIRKMRVSKKDEDIAVELLTSKSYELKDKMVMMYFVGEDSTFDALTED